MKQWDTVAIVGVGLLGGSIGLAMRRRELARRVVGIGRRESTLRTARRLGAITSTTTDLERGVKQAELVVVCTPVAQIVRHVLATAKHCPPGTLITDVGSTKEEIVDALNHTLADGARFVGSHPLAGGEKSGPSAAQEDLLEGRIVVVTPTAATPVKDFKDTSSLWTSLGASVVRMSPAAHDEALAATSHLPHLAASALACATPLQWLSLVATGWLDTTRVAAGDPELWREILLSNRANVLTAVKRYEKVLAALRRSLENDKDADLIKVLIEAKQKRDAVGS